jgi:hypothetical protein
MASDKKLKVVGRQHLCQSCTRFLHGTSSRSELFLLSRCLSLHVASDLFDGRNTRCKHQILLGPRMNGSWCHDLRTSRPRSVYVIPCVVERGSDHSLGVGWPHSTNCLRWSQTPILLSSLLREGENNIYWNVSTLGSLRFELDGRFV